MQTCRVCRSQDISLFFTDAQHKRYFRCETCLATMLDPSHFLTAEQELAHYNTHENDVDEPGYRDFLSRLSTPLLEQLKPNAQGLDYGCGPGPALAAMLREAEHGMALYDPFFAPDETVLDRQYDFITCTETVEHFHEPHEEFQKLAAMLKSGGLLAMMTMFQTDDGLFDKWHYRHDPTHVVFYRPETFEVMARQLDMSSKVVAKNVVFLAK